MMKYDISAIKYAHLDLVHCIEYILGSHPYYCHVDPDPPLRGGGHVTVTSRSEFFFIELPKQPKECIPNIFLTFWIAEVRFFDLKL